MKSACKKIAIATLALSTVFGTAAAQDVIPADTAHGVQNNPLEPAIPHRLSDARDMMQTLRRNNRQDDLSRSINATTIARLGTAFPELHSDAYSALMAMRNDPALNVRVSAALGLGRIAAVQNPAGAAAVFSLTSAARDQALPFEVREASIRGLGIAAVANPAQASRATDALLSIIGDRTPAIRLAAITALGHIAETHGDVYARDIVNQVGMMFSDTDTAVAGAARSLARDVCIANPNFNCPPIP